MTKLYKAIGCISGTAMDGIDVALIETDGYASINRIGFLSEPHDEDLRNRLRACLNKAEKSPEILAAERDFTLAHAPLILELINQFNYKPQDIDIIGFHGQTTHHNISKKLTLQIGDGALLADKTGIDVIYDMRQADVQAGGHGAPLLPVYHRALALNANLNMPVAVINIGGVGNITWINGEDMVAFDTGPGNAMIDDWIQTHTGESYDKDGAIAALGQADAEQIEVFLTHPYFSENYPKSLDRNDFNTIYTSLRQRPQSMDSGLRRSDEEWINNGAATLTEMTVRSLALGVSQCPEPPTALYITGGGRHNTTIMRRLAEVTGLPVHSIDSLGWNGDSMEAEGFAYMAVRSLLGEPYSFPTTTDCPKPICGGILAKSPHKSEAA